MKPTRRCFTETSAKRGFYLALGPVGKPHVGVWRCGWLHAAMLQVEYQPTATLAVQ